MKSISDLTDQAFEDASSLTHGEIVRLASFIADHNEHATFGAPPKPSVEKLGASGSLVERIAPMAPQPAEIGHDA